MINNIAIVIITFVMMEFVAWAAHKYLMHGFLWSWHEDHHQKAKYRKFFEKNDLFFLIFAIPAMSGFMISYFVQEVRFLFYISIGITLYGVAYFFIHEAFIHQRFPWFKRTNNWYLRAIRKAHKIHHKYLTKENGESFGMLIAHPKYFKEALTTKHNEP
ncbi:MAG: sterol desaturase family protein [Ignavibacteria bacterium]